jgi:serine/threonine-protein kinase HipA
MPASNKTTPSPLHVFAHTEAGFERAGLLDLSNAQSGDFNAVFSYDAAYVASRTGFALDPLNLALSTTRRATASKYVGLGVLFDAAPDAWGRRVIAAHTRQTASSISEDTALRLGRGNTIGALVFSETESLNPKAISPMSSYPNLDNLQAAASAVRNIETGTVNDAVAQELLAGSWSIGGARPKSLIAHEGALWIAKFATANEPFDRQRAEWACLRMARDIGFGVPEHTLAQTNLGSVLLVKRFDRGEDSEIRRHYISAASLVSAQPQSKRLDTPFDMATFSYANLGDIAALIGQQPQQARSEVFGRMLLNILLHNTDDHLKNHGFLRARGSLTKYELAPVFDISPQASGLHFLQIGASGRTGSLTAALQDARSYGLTRSGALAILDQLQSVFSKRGDYWDAAGISAGEVRLIEAVLGMRKD